MSFVKKRIMKIFSDGSVNFNNTFSKKSNKIKISQKDHTTFILNKKNSNVITTNSKDFESFKTRFLKFK